MKQHNDPQRRFPKALGAMEQPARTQRPADERERLEPPSSPSQRPRRADAPPQSGVMRPRLSRLLSSRASVRRAIVLSEVLAAPKALREPGERL
jgi:hypothetical protein